MNAYSLFFGLYCLFFSLSLFAEEAPPLKIGAILYLTGTEYSNVASEFKRGLELGIDEEKGPVELIIEDDHALPKNSATAARKLLDVDKVDVIFVSEYIQARVVGPLAKRANTPMVVIWESSPEIETINEYSFGIGLWTPSAGGMPAQHAIHTLKAKTASLIYDVTAWSTTVAKYFKEEFTRLGGTILLEEALPRGQSDFRSSLLKMKEKNADVLFAPVNDYPVAFFKQLKQMGYNRPVLSSDQISQEFIDNANGAMENIFFSNADDRMNPKLNILEKQYQRKYKTTPGNIHFVGLAHDAFRIVSSAWKKNNGEKLREELLATKDFPGLFGPVTINKGGTFARPEVMYIVKNGKQEHLK